ncbi:MAG: hypothetical protein LCH32_05485 [Bacteroidetes bacterium]|nr:hypothetical protein [Bacteroidota bacterium]
MLKNLTPNFLKKIDEYLIKNHPTIWVTRIHMVLFWFISLSVLSLIIGYLMPFDVINNNITFLWYALILITCFVLSWYWGYKNIVFNVEKNYGKITTPNVFANAFLTLICIYLLTVIPNFYVYANNQKINKTFSDKELFEDIATMDAIEPYIPTTMYNYENMYDTVLKVNKVNFRRYKSYYEYTPYSLVPNSMEDYNRDETIGFKPVKAIYDKKYLLSLINKHIQICSKYNVEVSIDPNAIADTFITFHKAGWKTTNYGDNNDFYKTNIKNAFRNIYAAKFQTPFYLDSDFLYVQLYIVFTLFIFIWLFKLSYWRQYLLTAVIFFLYPLITLIIFSIIPGKTDEMMFYSVFLYYLVSVFFTVKSFGTNHEFKPVQMIATIGTLILTLYMPMIIVSYLKECTPFFNYISALDNDKIILQKEINNTMRYAYSWEHYYSSYMHELWYQYYKKSIFIVKNISPIFVFLILPLFHKILTKQLALPKKN